MLLDTHFNLWVLASFNKDILRAVNKWIYHSCSASVVLYDT